MNAKQVMMMVAATAALAVQATPELPSEELTSYLQVSNVVMRQIAQNQDVYVDYELSGGSALVFLDICTNGAPIGRENLVSLSGDYSPTLNTLVSSGTNRIVWKARSDWKGHLETAAQAHIRVYRTNDLSQIPGIYMVVDLSGGPNAASYPISYTLTPPDPSNDVTCCSNQLWLKRVETNTFTMGSATTEAGHQDNETPHAVTLTNVFFIGVFPVTVAQYRLVTGATPSASWAISSALCPVDQVSYDDVRGAKTNTADNVDWPNTGYNVFSNSFFGVLRSKTGGSLRFDLPTEAQWEYACRAGTTTAWNDGSDFKTNSTGEDASLDNLGWYTVNSGTNKKSQPVGRKMPNAWGLYDCHGNVWEWCLDWYNGGGLGWDATTEPAGPDRGALRVLRGGGYSYVAVRCRSADRDANSVPSYRFSNFGFRPALVVRP